MSAWRLPADKVQTILRLLSDTTLTCRQIAKQVRVSKSSVSKIKLGDHPLSHDNGPLYDIIHDRDDENAYLPSEQVIRAECKVIKESWNQRVRHQRMERSDIVLDQLGRTIAHNIQALYPY